MNMVNVLWLVTIFLFLTGLWPIALICLLVTITMTISEKAKAQRNSGKDEK